MARCVFDMINKAGDAGKTIDELDAHFERLGHRHQTISARVNGLAEKGILVGGPDKRLTRKHCKALVWRATPEAVENFDALYNAPVKRSDTKVAAHTLTRRIKQITKRAVERSSDLPSLADAQRLATNALERLYATLR